VFGLSAAKGSSSVFSPPLIPEKRNSSDRGMNLSHLAASLQQRNNNNDERGNSGGRNNNNNNSSPNQVSGGARSSRSGTPSPAIPNLSSSIKDLQAFQNFMSNPLLSALSMFNAKDLNLKDLKDFSRFAANAANATNFNLSQQLSASTGSTSKKHDSGSRGGAGTLFFTLQISYYSK
jgi:hypothetical protein